MAPGYSRHMQQVVMPETMLEALLEERRRLGLDRRDEVWDGVVHMAPSPSRVHSRIQVKLVQILAPIAERQHLELFVELDMMDPVKGEQDYRQPDITIADPALTSSRAIQPGAHVAIEIVSANEDARAKLPFYARQRVQEVWLLDPRARTIEVYCDEVLVTSHAGVVRSFALQLELSVVDDALAIRDGDDVHRVDLRDVAAVR